MRFQAEEFFLFLSVFPVVFVPGIRINAGFGNPAGAARSPARAQFRIYLYFCRSYFSAKTVLSSPERDVIYPFHPGHHLMCHFHNRPKKDFGLLSYFALKEHFLQLCSAILNALFELSLWETK